MFVVQLVRVVELGAYEVCWVCVGASCDVVVGGRLFAGGGENVPTALDGDMLLVRAKNGCEVCARPSTKLRNNFAKLCNTSQHCLTRFGHLG